MLNLDLLKLGPSLRTKNEKNTSLVFDPVRRKWVALQPEEMVRQLLIQYFVTIHGFPLSRMSVERRVVVNGMNRRYDLVLWDRQAKPLLMAECKAPNVPVDQSVLDQIARYNLSLQVPFILVTNGTVSFCCKIDFEATTWKFISEIPKLNSIEL